MTIRAAIWVAAAGCGGGWPQPGFEEALTTRYHCGAGQFTAADEDRSLRLTLAFPTGGTTGATDDPTEPLEATLPASGVTATVWAGECLALLGCSDVPADPPCGQQIEARWEATAGTVRTEPEGGAVRAIFDGVRLEDPDGVHEPLLLDWTAVAEQRSIGG